MKPLKVRRRWFCCSSVPGFRRQYGVAGCTPRTVAIYGPAKLEPLPVPTDLDWVRFYASVGTDGEFLVALFNWLLRRKS